LSGVSIAAGTFFCCPSADPRCNPLLPAADYCYVVDHADEVLSFGGCPPIKTPGIGRVVAHTKGSGDSLTPNVDEISPCATANNSIRHACCEPCSGTCTEVAKANACSFPRIFTPDKNCDEVVCTRLDCDDHSVCTDDSCDAATGACVNEDNCGTPTIHCPPDKLFECDAVGDFGDPTVEDPCNPNPLANCTEDSTPGKLPLEQTIIRTCTYTNECGRSAMCEQRIDVVDTTAPVMTCPSDRRFECDAIGDFGVPTAVDNCDPTPVITIDVVEVIEDCTPGPVAGITPPPKLTITRTVTATEGSTAATGTGGGNIGTCVQRIRIVDTNPPLLVNCPGRITICVDAPSLPFTPPTCTDTCGTCDVTCVRSDHLPLHDPVPNGPITVTCVSTDECANESSCAFDVEVSEAGDCFVVIPTVSEWGLVILTLLLLTGAKIYFGHRPFEAA